MIRKKKNRKKRKTKSKSEHISALSTTEQIIDADQDRYRIVDSRQ